MDVTCGRQSEAPPAGRRGADAGEIGYSVDGFGKIELASTKPQHQSGWEETMADYNRGIMKFDGADSPVVVLLSAAVVAGVVSALIWWALHFAYAA